MNVHKHLIKIIKKRFKKEKQDTLFGKGHNRIRGKSKCPKCGRAYFGKYVVCDICVGKLRRIDAQGMKISNLFEF